MSIQRGLRISHVNDDDFMLLSDLLSYADKFVRLHRHSIEADVIRVYAQSSKLSMRE